MNPFTINNLTKTERAKQRHGDKTGRAEQEGQNRKKERKDGGRAWNNEKKEDDLIRYPPTKFLTKPI